MTDFLKEVGTTEVTQILGEMEIIIQTKSRNSGHPDGETWKTNFQELYSPTKFQISNQNETINKLDNWKDRLKGIKTPLDFPITNERIGRQTTGPWAQESLRFVSTASWTRCWNTPDPTLQTGHAKTVQWCSVCRVLPWDLEQGPHQPHSQERRQTRPQQLPRHLCEQ